MGLEHDTDEIVFERSVSRIQCGCGDMINVWHMQYDNGENWWALTHHALVTERKMEFDSEYYILANGFLMWVDGWLMDVTQTIQKEETLNGVEEAARTRRCQVEWTVLDPAAWFSETS